MAVNRNKPLQIVRCDSSRDATLIRANSEVLWVVPSDARAGEQVRAFSALTGHEVGSEAVAGVMLRNKLGPVRVVFYEDGTASWFEQGQCPPPMAPSCPGLPPRPAIVGITDHVLVRPV